MTRQLVILTAAINGGRPDAAALNPNLAITPRMIADQVAEAAGIGAQVAHLHMRDPVTGLPSNDLALWGETLGLIRAEQPQMILNLSASMNGFLFLAEGESGLCPTPPSDLLPVPARIAHVTELRPEIGTIDCGTFAVGDAIHVARLSDLQRQARLYRDRGVLAEVECFDLGHVEIARRLAAEGLLGPRPFLQICLGTGYGGAPATGSAFTAMYERLPEGATFAAFAAGAANLEIMRQSLANGGHIRAGLEDQLLDESGKPNTNAELLSAARALVEASGARLASIAEARALLGF